MKNIFKISLIILLSYFCYDISFAGAGVIDIPGDGIIKNVSINEKTGNIITKTDEIGISILKTIKYIVQGVLLIFLVYIGIQMVINGDKEDELKKAKTQIAYTLVAFIFINIPGTLYDNINQVDTGKITGLPGTWANQPTKLIIFNGIKDGTGVIFIKIIPFLEIIAGIAALFIIVLSGVKMIISQGKDDKIKELKDRIVYSILALVFIGFIEAWKKFAFSGNIRLDGVPIFQSGIGILLFFAGPVAFFFLSLAGYYLITANGEEDKVKKAKSIVINTILATIILIASYTFLVELGKFIKLPFLTQ